MKTLNWKNRLFTSTICTTIALGLGACGFSGDVGVQGKLLQADGITPLPNAQIAFQGRLDDQVINETTTTTVGTDGAFYEEFYVNITSTQLQPTGTLKITGSIGLLIENQLSSYSPDVRDALTKNILTSCVKQFESRDYPITTETMEKQSNGVYVIKQNFTVNVTKADLDAITTCQEQALNKAMGK
ncbi:hypothetical protein WDW37_03345 [Bdellovibrionota bacterium FG-1]